MVQNLKRNLVLCHLHFAFFSVFHWFQLTVYYSPISLHKTSCARGDTICLRPTPPLRASRAAEQTKRRSTFPRRIRSYADRCSHLAR